MSNDRLYIRKYQTVLAMVGTIILVTFMTLSGSDALADDRGVNSKTRETTQYGYDRSVPRSPGVSGLTDPSVVKKPCPVYSFSEDAPGSQPTAFPGGTLEGQGYVVVVGESWATWNPQTVGLHLLFADEGRYTIHFKAPVKAAVLKAEPNAFDEFPITVTAYDTQGRPLGSFTRTIVGDSGAAYLGLASQSRPIRSITISAPPEAAGFAFSDLTWGPSSCGSKQ